MVYYVYGNPDCQAPQGVAKQITKDCQYLLMSLCHIWIVRTNSTSLAKSFLKTIDLAETILGRGQGTPPVGGLYTPPQILLDSDQTLIGPLEFNGTVHQWFLARVSCGHQENVF